MTLHGGISNGAHRVASADGGTNLTCNSIPSTVALPAALFGAVAVYATLSPNRSLHGTSCLGSDLRYDVMSIGSGVVRSVLELMGGDTTVLEASVTASDGFAVLSLCQTRRTALDMRAPS